jgi:myo-inositol-1(or 4)-monophosphatase
MRPQVITSLDGLLTKASKGLIRDFGEIINLTSSSKREGFVVAAERRTESILYEGLHELYPDTNFLIEGKRFINHGGDHAPIWIIDPIDGTRNFFHGIPHFSVSVALKKGPYLTAAVVYDPLNNELFWASRGEGAFLDRMRLRVSGNTHLSLGIIGGSATSFKKGREQERNCTLSLTHTGATLRIMGSTALDLAYVAAGRYDGMWSYDSRPWDIAAGALIIKEAGGIITDRSGDSNFLETGNVIAGNEALHRSLLEISQKCFSE